MTISKQVITTNSALILLSTILAGLAAYNVRITTKTINTFTTDAMPGVVYGGEMLARVYQIRMLYWQHIASSDQRAMAAAEVEIARTKTKFTEAEKKYEESITQPEDRQRFDRVDPLFQKALVAWNPIAPVSRAGHNEEAGNRFTAEVAPQFEQLERLLEELVRWNDIYGDAAGRNATDQSNTARLITMIFAAAGLLGGGLATLLMVRNMNGKLRSAISDLKVGAEQVRSAARQVSSASQSLAQGSSEQAASLEETSASTHEVHRVTRTNTDDCRTAVDVSRQSEESFVRARAELQKTVVAMSAIGGSSEKISKIIKVIDEIAFQTNILALNAAVEAARAGEAGLGFAVVADEVRNLAQRCAQAARDTTALIEESIRTSGDGKVRVDGVASSISDVSQHLSRVKTILEAINNASQHQSQGITQIVAAMGQMEQVTQRTAAVAEEAASASEELSAQAETLEVTVADLERLVGAAA